MEKGQINGKEYIAVDYLRRIIQDRVIEYSEQSIKAEKENKKELRVFYDGCKNSLKDLLYTELE